MQNRYVADLGDFGKYGLLKYLCRGLRLGIIWYLVSNESHNSDGRHIRYRLFDNHVADLLAAIRYHGEHAAEQAPPSGARDGVSHAS